MHRLTAILLVIFFTAGLLFVGCGIVKTDKVEHGFDIQDVDVQNIVKGKTTERDILKTFGPPTKAKDTNEGKEYLYEYSKEGGLRWNLIVSVGGGSTIKTLIVWFNKQKVVTDYAFKRS
jgi:outer membrane protein assembly factor BamE (lipoprotein component of BamABCDE complex)